MDHTSAERTYRNIMLMTWAGYDTTALERVLRDDNVKVQDHRRWALICEVNAGYESNPDTRQELGKMQAHHAGIALFLEDEVAMLSEVLNARWAAEQDDANG